GESELALMSESAIPVNVGRGPIVDEFALFHALRDGTLHAAGLDVWYNCPTDEPGRSATSPSRTALTSISATEPWGHIERRRHHVRREDNYRNQRCEWVRRGHTQGLRQRDSHAGRPHRADH
ncbi:hypothetical protein KAT82_01590, partial [bacterium]|nr:hypothetical protein [bacterium]